MPIVIRQSARDRARKRRRRISKAFTGLHHNAERAALRPLGRFYRELTRTVLARVEAIGMNGFDVEEIFQPSQHRELFNRTMLPAWNRGVFAGVEFEAAFIESAAPGQQSLWRPGGLAIIRQEVDPANPTPPPSIHVDLSSDMQNRVRSFLRERQEGVWGDVGTTIHDRLRRAIQRGLKDGEDFDKMKSRIRSTMRGLSDYQAKRIARTETTGSLNFGQQIERDEIGITLKEWVSTIDQRNRGVSQKSPFDHLTPDGQVVKNNEPFLVSGEQLMHPADRSLGASAGNVIQCRCTGVAAFDDAPAPRRTTAPTSRTPAPDPLKDKPAHLAFTGKPTDLGRKVWQRIGDGIQDEQHARKVGKVVLDEVETRLTPLKTEKKAIDAVVQAADNELDRLTKQYELDPTDENDRSFWGQVHKVRELRQQQADIGVKLDKERASQTLDLLKQVRDFGKGGEHKWTGVRELRETMKQAEQRMPADWLRDSAARGSIRLEKRARGSYSDALARIRLGSKNSHSTATHELMHRMEYSVQSGGKKFEIGRLEAEFKARRAAGEQLSQIYPKSKEFGFKDDFTDHYIGKEYGILQAHEIMTMAWEGIMHGRWNVHRDADLMEFVLGIVAGI